MKYFFIEKVQKYIIVEVETGNSRISNSWKSCHNNDILTGNMGVKYLHRCKAKVKFYY